MKSVLHRLLPAVAFLSLAAHPPPTVGSDVAWSERAAGAPLQVVALCQSRSSRWEGGAIYSYSQLSVIRVIRGANDAIVTVRQRGGEVDGVGQRVSHVTLLEPGQRYLLFLEQDDLGNWAPNAMGVNPVSEGDGGGAVGGQSLDEIVSELGGAH
jgi:hypothetical protein